MRQVTGDQLGDFAAIYDEDVELVSVTRPQARVCEALSRRLIRSRQVPELRWVQSVDDSEAPTRELPSTIDADVASSLFDQIAEASEMLGELLECEQVGVRLETLNAPMCPRFHVDHIPCRMLITLSGEGTDWIPNSEVDWRVFDNLETAVPPIHENNHLFSTHHPSVTTSCQCLNVESACFREWEEPRFQGYRKRASRLRCSESSLYLLR